MTTTEKLQEATEAIIAELQDRLARSRHAYDELAAHDAAGTSRAIPASAVCFYMDGDQWCCVHGDFVNLQESPAGFGATFEDALESLQAAKIAVDGR